MFRQASKLSWQESTNNCWRRDQPHSGIFAANQDRSGCFARVRLKWCNLICFPFNDEFWHNTSFGRKCISSCFAIGKLP
jgi:hypothetical protein